jgi:methenyltetrahydrofolate cyclohydrolase
VGADHLLGLRVEELLDALAAEGPRPASGSAAALVVALAAALTAMAARSSPDWDEARAIAAQATALRKRVEPLVAADADAYADVLRILREPEGIEPRMRDFALGESLALAAELPLAIAEAALDAAELAAHAAKHCEATVRADAAGAAWLAAGAAHAAANLVRVNLGMREDDERLRRADQLSAAAESAAQRATSG